jgi:DHA2 family multidrug resistance protein
MMLAGRLVGPLKARNLIGCGFAVAAFSLWQMSHYNLYMDEGTVIWSGFLQGLGLGLISVPLTTATFSTLAPQLRGAGTSIYSLSRNIGSSIGISFVQTELTRNTQIAHSSLIEHINAYNLLAQANVLPWVWNLDPFRASCAERRSDAAGVYDRLRRRLLAPVPAHTRRHAISGTDAPPCP